MPGPQDAAVSSVVGTVLMLGITIAVFAGLSVVVLDHFESEPRAPRVDLGAAREEGGLVLLNEGGDPVPLEGLRLLVNVAGVEQEADASAVPGAAALGEALDLGEALCVQGGDPARCLFAPADDVRGAILLHDSFLLVQVGPRGLPPGSAPPERPDLEAAAPTLSLAGPGAGDSLAFSAVVSNAGPAGIPAVPITVEFLVDGASLGTVVLSGPLASGGAATATSPAWTAAAGDHTVRAVVDGLDAIAESDEADNAAEAAFAVSPGVADPGYPFEDADGDGRYTAGVDQPVATADLADGSHACSGGTLSIPPSVGDITADSIDFSCAGEDVSISVSLVSTSGPLNLAADGDIVLAPGVTLESQGGMRLEPQGSLFGNGTVLRSESIVVLGDSSAGQAGTDFYLAGATLDNTQGTSALTIQLEGTLDLTGATLLSRGAIDLGGYNSGHLARAVLLEGATLDNTQGTAGITVHDVAGAVRANGTATRFASKGAIALSAPGGVSLAGATLDNGQGSSAVAVAGGPVFLAGAAVTSTGAVTVSGTGTLDLAGATVDNSAGSGALQATTTSGLFLGNQSRLASKGALLVSAPAGVFGNQGATPLAWDNSAGSSSFTVTSGAGRVEAGNARWSSKGALAASGHRGVNLAAARLDTSQGGGAVTLGATAGAVDCNACTVLSADDVGLSGLSGTMDVRGASLTALGSNDLSLTVSSGYPVLVQGATLADRNGKANVTPDGAASGTPAAGGVE